MPDYYKIRDATENDHDLGNGHYAASWQHVGPGPQPLYYEQSDRFLARACGPMNAKKLKDLFAATNAALLKAAGDSFSRAIGANHLSDSEKLKLGEEALRGSGSMATLAYVAPNKHILTANAGDSRVNLYIINPEGWTRGYALTEDHGTENEREIDRVRNLGGDLVEDNNYFTDAKKQRLIASARGFGNHGLSSIMSYEAEVNDFDLTSHPFYLKDGERVVIVAASDGGHRDIPASPFQEKALNEALTNGANLKSSDDFAKHFATVAIKPHPSRDNVTIVASVINFDENPSFVIGVMDGNGEDGQFVAEAVRDSFDQLIPSV